MKKWINDLFDHKLSVHWEVPFTHNVAAAVVTAPEPIILDPIAEKTQVDP
jgi:hypothetical protein